MIKLTKDNGEVWSNCHKIMLASDLLQPPRCAFVYSLQERQGKTGKRDQMKARWHKILLGTKINRLIFGSKKTVPTCKQIQMARAKGRSKTGSRLYRVTVTRTGKLTGRSSQESLKSYGKEATQMIWQGTGAESRYILFKIRK